MGGDFSRFKPIIPLSFLFGQHWISSGSAKVITDSAPLIELGGPTKIDSIQNVILLRGDLHNA